MKNITCGINVTPIDDIDWKNLDSIIINNEECDLITPPNNIWSYIIFAGFAIFGLIMLICITGEGNPPIVLIPIMLACVFGGKYMDGYSKKKYLREFREKIANSIENSDSEIIRIRKRNKMGLYNTKKSELLLPAVYDYIEDDFYNTIKFFENGKEIEKENLFEFLLVVKNEKCGIYSPHMRKFILKCKYDSIIMLETFEEYAEVIKEGKIVKVRFD